MFPLSRSSQVYINWMNFFVNLLTPVVALVVLNILIYRNMPRLGAPAPARPLQPQLSPLPTTSTSPKPPPTPTSAPPASAAFTTASATNGGANGQSQLGVASGVAIVFTPPAESSDVNGVSLAPA